MVAKNERKAESTRQNVVEAKSGSKPLRVASAELKPKSKKVAISDSKPKPIKVARVEAKLKPRRTEKRKARSFGGAKVHVVKANETLYRVATYYELSVEQLRRLNRMGPKDTHIRPGQRLRVSG
jgi:membrane-bound lytic murein transglycosylase D